MSLDDDRGYLAPAQAAIRFCMTPDVFPQFRAWLISEFPQDGEEFFNEAELMEDLIGVRDLLQPAEHALIKAGFPLSGADR
jgi:hypothetical protein